MFNRKVRNTLVAIIVLALLPFSAFAGSSQLETLTAEKCEAFAGREGVQIVRFRWTENKPREVVLLIPFPTSAPAWYVNLITGWINSAYDWHGHPDAWLRMISESCQGT